MPQRPLILASGSPRRRGLLQASGVDLAGVQPPNVPEERGPDEPAVVYARRLAREKASAVGTPGAVVLAADTVVHADQSVFEKPTDDRDAFRILSRLSGRWHQVTTAWAIAVDGVIVEHAHTTSEVRFHKLTDDGITAYIATGEGTDKAGAYGIQGLGAALVAEVRGSYPNVVGLPLAAVLPAIATARAAGVPQ